MNIINKYVKFRSVTWWVGFTALAAGVTMATPEVSPQMAPVANFIQAVTGISTPYALIASGLGLIGLRGKDG